MTTNVRKTLFLVWVMLIAAGPSFAGEEQAEKTASTKWPEGASPAEVGRKVAENSMKRTFGHYHTHACTLYGVLIFSEAAEDTKLRDAVARAYEPYLSEKKKPVIGHVDNNLFGIVGFELFRQTGKKEYLKVAKYLADEEWENPREDGLTKYTRWWMDDMYMVGSLQAQAHKALKEAEYADRGVNFLLAYVKRLQQPNGLFHHRVEWPFFWVRGNGWASAGMTEMLLTLPADHPKRAELMAAYLRTMNGLVKTQGRDGMWPQLLDYPNVRPESSGTGMYVFALATGVDQGWLPEKPYRAAAERGWLALTGYVDSEGRAREVSQGTCSTTVKPYLCNNRYPVGDLHGQAGILWAATAVMRLSD